MRQFTVRRQRVDVTRDPRFCGDGMMRSAPGLVEYEIDGEPVTRDVYEREQFLELVGEARAKPRLTWDEAAALGTLVPIVLLDYQPGAGPTMGMVVQWDDAKQSLGVMVPGEEALREVPVRTIIRLSGERLAQVEA